ncbi:hypothetical protein WKT02_06045 [Erysipelotrichaceae bacterium HCN-30851]
MLFVPTFLIPAIIYLLLTSIATGILNYIESRMNMTKVSSIKEQEAAL